MTDEKITSVIEKIKKLFALAHRPQNNDGSGNQAEAATAMAMAQQLLAKYNLDLAQIKDSETNAAARTDAGPREKVKISRSAQYRWQQSFWKALAEMNFCFHWVVQVREEHKSSRTGRDYRIAKRHVILGSQVNVAAVTMMGEYLTEVLERELPYSQQERLSRAALSWREGAAERLIERLKERTEAMKRGGFKAEDGSQVTALAVQDLHEKEYAANYDAQYGAGAYARMKKRQAEWDQQAAERRKEQEDARARQLAGETPSNAGPGSGKKPAPPPRRKPAMQRSTNAGRGGAAARKSGKPPGWTWRLMLAGPRRPTALTLTPRSRSRNNDNQPGVRHRVAICTRPLPRAVPLRRLHYVDPGAAVPPGAGRAVYSRQHHQY
jgi:hypothetical protein